MTDYFALLEEPRRPWLDADALKQKFLLLSSAVHPDRVHNAAAVEKQTAQEQYTELNAAYNCLREPKERLRHLLELERGAKPQEMQRTPPDLMNLFVEVSRLCREADTFLAERAEVSSPLLKVRLFERAQQWSDKLSALQQTLSLRREALAAELKMIDARWESRAGEADRNANLARLEELYRLFSYFGRWSGQIQERVVQLSF